MVEHLPDKCKAPSSKPQYCAKNLNSDSKNCVFKIAIKSLATKEKMVGGLP
jgi:hypothetical protein